MNPLLPIDSDAMDRSLWAVLTGPVRKARLEESFAEPFRGIALGGELQQGLFPIRSTGVSTAPIVETVL